MDDIADARMRDLIRQRNRVMAERDYALELAENGRNRILRASAEIRALQAERDAALREVKREVQESDLRTQLTQRTRERDAAVAELERLKGLLAGPNYIAALHETQERAVGSDEIDEMNDAIRILSED